MGLQYSNADTAIRGSDARGSRAGRSAIVVLPAENTFDERVNGADKHRR